MAPVASKQPFALIDLPETQEKSPDQEKPPIVEEPEDKQGGGSPAALEDAAPKKVTGSSTGVTDAQSSEPHLVVDIPDEQDEQSDESPIIDESPIDDEPAQYAWYNPLRYMPSLFPNPEDYIYEQDSD